MSVVLLVVTLAATVLFLVVMMSVKGVRMYRNSCKLPPGTKGLPIVGETLSFIKTCSSNELGEFMERRLAKYGDIFTSRLAGEPRIVYANAELNRIILRNKSRLFGMTKSSAYKKITGRNSILCLEGDAHKYLRSYAIEFLGGYRVKTTFLEDANMLASHVLNKWQDGSTIFAHEEVEKFSMWIMAKKIASMKPNDTRIAKLGKYYASVYKGLACVPINFPGTVFWKALKARKKILSIFIEEMEERVKKVQKENQDDFLTLLMTIPNFSEEQICDFILGDLFAAFESISKEITSLIYFLEGCPKAISQLREEHLQVARAKKQRGEIKLTWDEYKSMEFTKCVINETLRLANAVPLLPRSANEDIEFKGYTIPKYWEIIVHLTAVHLDPSHFDDPQSFNPWRWLKTSGKNTANIFMPFGGGARMCPAAELAKMEMAVFLHHLIIKYNWNFVETDTPIRTPLIEFRKGLPIIVTKISAES